MDTFFFPDDSIAPIAVTESKDGISITVVCICVLAAVFVCMAVSDVFSISSTFNRLNNTGSGKTPYKRLDKPFKKSVFKK